MIDRETLLKSRLAERTVDVDGGTVRVRALSRGEVLRIRTMDEVEADVFALAHAVLEPELSEADVRVLLANSDNAAVQPIVTAVMELSGLVEGAQKSGRTGADDR